MLRREFLSKLDVVGKAIANNSLVPSMLNAWLTGDTLLVFNDHLSISTPFESEFVGGVNHALLSTFLKSANAKDVEIEKTDSGKALVKCGRSKLTMPHYPKKNMGFSFPEGRKKLFAFRSKKTIDAFKNCLLAVGAETSLSGLLGITLLRSNGNLFCYSTNGSTLARSVLSVDGLKVGDPIMLPWDFCKQFISLASSETPELSIYDTHVVFESKDGTVLHCDLVVAEKTVEFERVFSEHWTKENRKSLVEMPKKFISAFERAGMIANVPGQSVPTSIDVKDGKATILTESSLGRVSDSVSIEGHPDIALHVNAKFMLNCSDFDQILLTNKSVLMSSDGHTFLVSTMRV